MFDRVLIPLDGSPLAEEAVPQTVSILRRRDFELVLFRAVDFPVMLDVAPSVVAGALEEEARRYLKAAAQKFQKDLGLRVRWVSRYVTPGEGIADLAAEEAATLIAMTTHGRSGIRRWAFGSVTEKVIRSGIRAPILVLRSAPPAIRRILVPLDGSPASRAVLPYAEELARRHEATLVPVHVRDDGLPALPDATEIQEGDPAMRILEVAGIDFIAMATHGRSGLKRWMLGSVTEKVLRHATVPMLVVREEP